MLTETIRIVFQFEKLTDLYMSLSYTRTGYIYWLNVTGDTVLTVVCKLIRDLEIFQGDNGNH
jgi:hypothetical protein